MEIQRAPNHADDQVRRVSPGRQAQIGAKLQEDA